MKNILIAICVCAVLVMTSTPSLADSEVDYPYDSDKKTFQRRTVTLDAKIMDRTTMDKKKDAATERLALLKGIQAKAITDDEALAIRYLARPFMHKPISYNLRLAEDIAKYEKEKKLLDDAIKLDIAGVPE